MGSGLQISCEGALETSDFLNSGNGPTAGRTNCCKSNESRIEITYCFSWKQ